jgi:GDPmannose 4,6-dehydratase
MSNRVALICGVSGQDGALLARFLLDKGYTVAGTSRDAQLSSFSNLDALGIRPDVRTVSMSLDDFRSVLMTLDRVKPDEIYNLAGQSSVGLSFDEPAVTLQSHVIGSLNLLEAMRFMGRGMRLYSAGSAECFGDLGSRAADEHTPFRPCSPYGVAKAAAHWQAINYRQAYGLHVCSGILFNHESPLRPARFVTRKVVAAACRIARGSGETLSLGDLSIRRDWGWAPEYVDAMWRMLQVDVPQDFVIATGESASLEDYVAEVFACLDLDWRAHVVRDDSLLRPSEIRENRGDPWRAAKELGWRAQRRMPQVARALVECELGGRFDPAQRQA